MSCGRITGSPDFAAHDRDEMICFDGLDVLHRAGEPLLHGGRQRKEHRRHLGDGRFLALETKVLANLGVAVTGADQP